MVHLLLWPHRGKCSQRVEIVAVAYKRISVCCCFAIPDQGHSICAYIGGSCALALAADSAKGAGLTAQLWEVGSCSRCFIFSIPCFALQYSWKKLEMPSFCMSALKAVLFCIDFWGASACQSLIIVKYVIYE